MRFLAVALVAATFAACNEEEAPTPSDNLGITEMFGPAADADPRVKKMYEEYGVNVIMDWENWKDVYNSTLAIDQVAINWNLIPEKVAPENVDGGIVYAQTLLSNCSPQMTKAFFPLEWWLVGTYSGSYWAAEFRMLGRNRFLSTWPNKTAGVLPITDPANHYYYDEVLARNIWRYFMQASVQHMGAPVKAFADAGRAYDGGKAVDLLSDQLTAELDAAKLLEPASLDDLLPGETLADARTRIRTAAETAARAKSNAAIDQLCIEGGFIPDVTAAGNLVGSSANSFENDFSSWASLVVTESYENIRTKYLDNSPARKAKYEALIEFCKSYGWDIQAAGNKFRQMNNQFVPPVEP
jgi:predicted small secreted protein